MKAEIERLRWNVPRSPWAKFRSEEMLESLGWIRRNEKRQDILTHFDVVKMFLTKTFKR